MKIEINIKNSSICFNDCNIELSKKGIYLVTGPNGIGKTSIVKNIVFTNRFEDHNRNHFSYVEQDPERYDVTVKDYLYRYNQNANKQIIDSLIDSFGLKYLQMNKSILKLSGGELVKLNIIAALGKDNDFVFLDEPTNNLDNDSVDCLVKILSSYMSTKIVVVVSHDPRLKIINHHTIEISKNSINVEYQREISETSLISRNKRRTKYPWQNILTRHFFRPLSIVNIALLLVYAGIFLFVNNISYSIFYDAEELASRNGSVLIYSVDKEYGELSQKFAKCEDIHINEEKYYSLIQYDSVLNIVEDYNVENVYIENAIVATQIMDRLHSGNISEDFPTFSVPQIIQGYSNQINPIVSSQYIAEGRYPEDEKKELVASQRIIDQCFLGKTIGDTVIWDNSEWTIVGIHYLDIIITSYNPNDITGYFYRYNPKSYDAFLQSQIEFKKEIDAPITDYYRPDILVLQTNVSQERSLLLDIFTKYPANNYRSYSYDKDISDYNNSKFFSIIFLMNIASGILLGLVFIMVNRKRCVLYKAEANSIDNYYLTNHYTARLFGWGDTVLTSLILIFYLLLASRIANYSKEFLVLSVGFGILCFVSSVPYWLGALKKYD